MHIIRTFGHVLGGTLLIAGTSIGVGMLALPVATAQGGFFFSTFVYFLCWLFMLATGLLLVEACIWMPKGANLVTLASKLLGKPGKVSCWILYLFLFSCLMVAHVAGGGMVVRDLTHHAMPLWLSTCIYTLAFAPIVYFGTIWVDRMNLGLMCGIIITYTIFLTSAASSIHWDLLAQGSFLGAWTALPVIFTAFGYQSLIPTLMTYLNRNIRNLRIAIVCGTTIPFLIYILWEMTILGIVPLEGAHGLLETLKQGGNAVSPLRYFLNNPSLVTVGRTFAFFALTTSFLGISIAFVDFLSDSLRTKKTEKNRLNICLVIFLLPLIITWIDPHLFITALNYAGGVGVALLLGAMPVLMIWSGRYYHGYSLMHQQLPGGKVLLFIMLVFVGIELMITFLY